MESTTTDSLTKRMVHQVQNPEKMSGYIRIRTLTRLPLLEAGFSYFRGAAGLDGVVLLGFLHLRFQKGV